MNTHTQIDRLTFFLLLMERFKIHDCCFKKQKKANKNNVKSCTKYSIYEERKAIKKKHDTWWAQESHWWCHFSIWARIYPKTISKKHKVSLSPGHLMSFVVEVLFVSSLPALRWICHDVWMSCWPHKLHSQQPPVHSFA